MNTAVLERPTDRAAKEPEVMRLSPSIAKILLDKSPLHAWTAHRLGGDLREEPSDAMVKGNILDKLLLGGTKEFCIIDAPDYRTKAAQAERDDAIELGKIPVLACKMNGYQRTVERWKEQFRQAEIYLTGESQKTLVWETSGVPCKGILDHLIIKDNYAVIYDLKSTTDASVDAIQRSVASFGHDVQHAAYVEGVETLYPHLQGRVRMGFIFCEVQEPFAVNVVELAGTFKSYGKHRWSSAVKTWGECLAAKHWPGYAGLERPRIEAPGWLLNKMTEGESDGVGY